MPRVKVGVFRGGPSGEYEVSLRTGGSVISSILEHFPQKYQVRDIFISRDGEWYMDGLASSQEQVFKEIDVAFNALHGSYGEDGKVQQIFDSFKVPYTGSGVATSLLAIDKSLSKRVFLQAGIKTPRGIVVASDNSPKEAALEVLRLVGPPWVVKPTSLGSSLGVSTSDNFRNLVSSISTAFEYSPKVLVEEHIKGREATCGVLENFRGKEHYSLPVVEVIPTGNKLFFDYSSKYKGEVSEICPSGFKRSVKEEIERLSVLAHRALACRHYSRSDFIVSDKGVYILETNTLPGLTAESLLPKSLEAIGLPMPNFIDHLIERALKV